MNLKLKHRDIHKGQGAIGSWDLCSTEKTVDSFEAATSVLLILSRVVFIKSSSM